MLERRRERREAAVSNGEAYLICVPMCLLEKERVGRHLGDWMLQIGVNDWGIGGELPFCRVAGKMIGMEQKKRWVMNDSILGYWCVEMPVKSFHATKCMQTEEANKKQCQQDLAIDILFFTMAVSVPHTKLGEFDVQMVV